MPGIKESKGYIIIKEMMAAQNRQPFLFQEKAWEHICNGESGLVNAPTGLW
jgi:ATP-dependent Lhr-like helicase